MAVRGSLALVAALLLAVQVVRTAALEQRPGAARFWSWHPQSELSVAASVIAVDDRDNRAKLKMLSLVSDAARKEPMAAAPFVIEAREAQLAGDSRQAERLFKAAQWRDPRSLPAAYFLADQYLRTGQPLLGIGQIAALARLDPAGPIAPYVAAYARDRRTWPTLRGLLRADARLRDIVLPQLALNIETVPAVLAIADQGDPWAGAPWFSRVLVTLSDAGQYQQAHRLWSQAIGARYSGELLYDPAFTDPVPPPPFNWSLASSAVGVAKRQAGGGLHVVFFGKEDGFLASQLLILPPGAYTLAMELAGDPARARSLSWSLWCDKSGAPLVSMSLDSIAVHGMHFTVPASCPSQWLRLGGASFYDGQRTQVAIHALKLERTNVRG